MASSVQFIGSDAVLKACENRNCPAWSLWQGRQFMFKHDASTVDDAINALQEVLEMIGESTNAIYTLKVYEDLKPGTKIKENTPADGSFNFRLNNPEQMITNSQYSRQVGMNQVLSELNAIKLQLAEKEEEEEEEETDTEKTLGKIGDLMNNPVVMQLASMFLGKTIQLPAPAPGSLGNVGDQETKIKNALVVLKEHDARLGDHLEKLAAIAVSKKESFLFLINTLDQM